MQSRVEFLHQTIQALESVEHQVGQLKSEVKELHEDANRMCKYGLEKNEELDKQIVLVLGILDELVDSFDNILASPGHDMKTQRETDYRYSVRKDAKPVEAVLAEYKPAAVK